MTYYGERALQLWRGGPEATGAALNGNQAARHNFFRRAAVGAPNTAAMSGLAPIALAVTPFSLTQLVSAPGETLAQHWAFALLVVAVIFLIYKLVWPMLKPKIMGLFGKSGFASANYGQHNAFAGSVAAGGHLVGDVTPHQAAPLTCGQGQRLSPDGHCFDPMDVFGDGGVNTTGVSSTCGAVDPEAAAEMRMFSSEGAFGAPGADWESSTAWKDDNGGRLSDSRLNAAMAGH
jgi:hypothetical protein